MLKKAGTLLLICGSLATWVSCGKNAAHYLYAAIPGSSQIYVYREDPNSGLLTELSLSPVAAGPGVQSLALHPSNKYLYAANSGEADVSLFTISSDGAIMEVFPRATTGVAPNMLAMDPAGAYLYVSNLGSGSAPSISVFSIGTGGALTEIDGSPFQSGLSASNMKLNPAGTVLFIEGGGTPGYVEAFSVNPASISAGTFLSPVAGGPFQTGNNPDGIAITSNTSNGSYLYTSNGDNSIWQFPIESSGALGTGTSLGQEAGQTNPLSLLIDNSGSYLCVANENSANIGVYSIGTNGSLTALQVSPFVSDAGPEFIASDPTAEYLFVGTQIPPTKIQSFALSTSTGALTSVESYSVPGTPTSIVIVP
jgi:6-phosphogluconolactonase (cycloisomerase 2 family)